MNRQSRHEPDLDGVRRAIEGELADLEQTWPHVEHGGDGDHRRTVASEGWNVVFAALEELPDCDPPTGAAEETAAWLATLPLPGAFRRRMLAVSPVRPTSLWAALELVRSQMKVFSGRFWVVAVLVMGLAAAVTWGLAAANGSAGLSSAPARLALPLAVLSPALAAAGVSYALRSFGKGPWEVELSCPITPVGMALGRLGIVVAYVTGLALATTLTLWGISGPARASGTLGLVVETWLAPVLFLALLSFYLSLRVSPLVGTVVSQAVWALALVLRGRGGPVSLVVAPGDPGPTGVSCMLLALAALLLVASVRAAGQVAERAGRTAA